MERPANFVVLTPMEAAWIASIPDRCVRCAHLMIFHAPALEDGGHYCQLLECECDDYTGAPKEE